MAAIEVLFLISGVFILIYLWCKQNYSYWKRKGIPYIEPVPILGNTKDIFTMKKGIGLYLSDFYNEPIVADAPVVGIYTLHAPALIIREPNLIKSILIKDFNMFSNRHSQCDPHGDALGSNNIFFIRNPQWKEARTKLTPVFTSGKIKKMYPLMLQIAADLETHLESYPQTDKTFVAEVKEVCASFTTDLIATIAFGVRANSLQNPNGEFRTQGRKMFLFTIGRALDFFIAFFLPNLVTMFRVKLFSAEFSTFLRRTINDVINQREANGTIRNDLIDILVGLKKEAALEGPESTHLAKDNDFLVAQAALFLTAGFETSSSTMAFALYELSRNPDIQKRVRAEIHKALLAENGTISYDSLASLKYLDMILDEVLRLYPVLPFLDRQYSPVKGEPEFTLKPYYDYTMRDKMPIYIPIYALQRDPKYWPNPNKFDPERFNSENKKLQTPMTYMPFGTGPHYCIGNRIGLLQSKLGLIHFLKNHYVTTCEKTIADIVFDPKALALQCVGGIYLKVVNDRFYDIESSKQ